MNFKSFYEAEQLSDIKRHLKSRGIDFDRTRVIVDEENEYATFFLYNLSGKLVGYQRYNPKGVKTKSGGKNTPKSLWRYASHVTDEGKGKAIAVYGLETYKFTDPAIWIVEGIFDAVKLHNENVPAIAVLSNGASPSLVRWLKTLPQTKIVIHDNDQAGNRLKKLGDVSFAIPSRHKDLGDMPQDEVAEFVNDIKTKMKI